ncbi:MAG: hypothetical protein ABI651_04980 [Verrucomicrobiota bacterium]
MPRGTKAHDQIQEAPRERSRTVAGRTRVIQSSPGVSAYGDSAWLVGMLFAMGLFVADSYTLCLVGSSNGLTSKNSTQAFLRTIGYGLVFPWVVFLAVLGVWGVLLSGNNSAEYFGWLVAIWFLVGYVWDFGLCAGSIVKLSMEFRSVAACNFGKGWFNWRVLNRN